MKSESTEDKPAQQNPAEVKRADVRNLKTRLRLPLLLITALVVSTSGLVYELLAGALASARLGDSVTQFSVTIGVYLFAMGIGAYLSQMIKHNLPHKFVEVELALGLVGGLLGPLLFLGFGDVTLYRVVLYTLLVIIGVLVGVEIPLLLRILKEEVSFDELVAKVLGFDYLGALIGSLAFALFFVPTLGMMRTSIVSGLSNVVVALVSWWALEHHFTKGRTWWIMIRALLVTVILGLAFTNSSRIERWGESDAYGGTVLFSEQTPYQRIVVTRGHGSFQLHLNGNLQFSSSDEYRYHEALVHPAFAATTNVRRVLVLGGGDGLAVREILKYPNIEHVTLVDLDPAMTRMARRNTLFRSLNRDALSDLRVRVVNDDAFVWLSNHRQRTEQPRVATADDGEATSEGFDVVLVDFPDPNNYSLGKLYTTRFYGLVQRAMNPGATLVVQSTSPLWARHSFWCITHTIAAAGFSTRAYHALVPSFGEWGYVMAQVQPFPIPRTLSLGGLRYLSDAVLPSMFEFGPDMAELDAPVNRLNDQPLVELYEREWGQLE